MLSEPKIFVLSHWFVEKTRVFPESSFLCALNDNCDKGTMYKNMHEYLLMASQTGVFRMAMICTGYYPYSYIIFTVYIARASAETTPSLCYQSLIIFTLAIRLRRLRSEKKSQIWKPNNQLFCDQKAITSLRLNLFQQTKIY